MDIKKIDKNFDTTFIVPEDIEWFSFRELPCSIHGVKYSEEEGLFRRLPQQIAEAASEGVAYLSKNTAGGRIRFSTDSPYVAIRVDEPFEQPFPHMTMAGKFGVSLFANCQFLGTVMPSYKQVVNADSTRGGTGRVLFDGIKYPYETKGEIYQVEIFLPLYSRVCDLDVGLKKGCKIQKAKPYKHTKPILFYGSSITQGGCASKPGDDYINRLCRMLDTDVINLGFSGNAKAEKIIVDYIARQNPSIFVLDYDYNAPNAEYLEKTHFPLYEEIRKVHPYTPIIIMPMPTIEGYEKRERNNLRKSVILNTFNKAIEKGDKNVYFVDCYGCFGALENGECGTVDGCHPDSLGFFRMAEKLYPLLNRLLND